MAEPWEQDVPIEVAPVRAGEELDWERLEAYLRPVLELVDDVMPMTVLQFPNGSANLTYLLSFGDRRFVLRRPPFGVLAPGAHDMAREYRVLSRMWHQYGRAPRAFTLCTDHDIVGADFVVSEYRSGEVIWATLPPSMVDLPDAARRVGLATVDALADLHLADPAACGLSDLGRPDGFLDRQLSGWRKRWDLVASPEHAATMEAAGDGLARRKPRSSLGTFLHNDFKLDNCQFTPGQPDRVTSVFDWDMATLGDPLVDFGTLLNYWPDPSDTPDDRALHVPGMERIGLPPRADVVERYAARTGFDIADVHWYEAFACWRVAVICQQLYQRYLRGESTDERMASRGDNVGMLANRSRRILAENRGDMMDIDLTGRVALVTGGSRGLGREMVLAFAEHGADVVIASRRLDTCEEVAEEVRRTTGRRALPVACHVGRWDDLERLTDAAYAEFGRVDVLVNNAGMAPVYPSLVEATEELFDKVIGVNLKGPFRLSALIGERMTAGDGGSMINVSSIAVNRPQVHDIPYAAAKAGLNTMTLGLATALGPKVRVNCVMVGPFLTDISKAWDVDSFQAFAKDHYPLERLGEPHEIVGTALYLASDLSSFTTGTVITVDGGVSVSSPFPTEG